MSRKLFQWIILFGVTVCTSLILQYSIHKEVLAQNSGQGEYIELYLPFAHMEPGKNPGDIPTLNKIMLGRTGYLYKDDYIAKGIGQAGKVHGDTKCVDDDFIVIDGVTRTDPDVSSKMNYNNFFCSHRYYPSRTEYHDSTKQVDYPRGSIDFSMYGQITSASTGVVVWEDDKLAKDSNCVGEGNIQVWYGEYIIEYKHTLNSYVNQGDEVSIGQYIADTGNCGLGSEGVHLHLTAFRPLEAPVVGKYQQPKYDVEIRFLDASARLIDPSGLPMPSRRSGGGANGSVVGQVYYIADPVKGDRNSVDWNYLYSKLQYGMRVRISPSTHIISHNNIPGSINSVDMNNYQVASSEVLQNGEIYRAPVNWSGKYPHVIAGATYWYYKASNGVEGWVAQSDMNGCLSDDWCDIAPTDSLYPFAVAAKARSESGGGGFEGCYNNQGKSWLCSNYQITRGEAAKVLWEVAMGQRKPENCSSPAFDEVPANHTFCPYIQILKNLGIVQGKGNGKNFDPNGNVTRAEFASMVMRAMTHQDYGRFQCNFGNTDKFAQFVTDVPDGNPHKPSILCLWNATRDHNGLFVQKYNRQILLTQDRKFHTDRAITRLETTQMLALSLALLDTPNQTDEQGNNNTRGTGPCRVVRWLGIQACGVSSASVQNEITHEDFQLSTPANDEDWLILNVEEPGEINFFTFNNEPNAQIVFELFDSAGAPYSMVGLNKSGDMFTQRLGKGTYYLRLTNRYNTAFWGTNYIFRIQPGNTEYKNIALGKPVRASARESEAGRAIDGDGTTSWSSRNKQYQWIKIDLGSLQKVDKIRLLISQTLAGMTDHNIYIFSDSACSNPIFVHNFYQNTKVGDWLEKPFSESLYARCVMVETMQFIDWISWIEIEILQRRDPPIVIPVPESIPTPPAASTVEQVFEAINIGDMLLYPGTAGDGSQAIELRFKLYNQSSTDFVMSNDNSVCLIGSLNVTLQGPVSGNIGSQDWVLDSCFWKTNASNAFVFTKTGLNLIPGDYEVYVEFRHNSFPQGKQPKTATAYFNVPMPVQEDPVYQIYLPLVRK